MLNLDKIILHFLGFVCFIHIDDGGWYTAYNTGPRLQMITFLEMAVLDQLLIDCFQSLPAIENNNYFDY